MALGGRPAPPNSITGKGRGAAGAAPPPGSILPPKKRIMRPPVRDVNGIARLNGTRKISRNLSYAKAPAPDLGMHLGASLESMYDGNAFDVTVGVECNRGASKVLFENTTKNARVCRNACTEKRDCTAAEFDEKLGKCALWRECMYREPAMRTAGRVRTRTGDIRVMHRVGREWPVPASEVVWRTNCTIVVASYTFRLDWLRTVPDSFDVALYHKHDYSTDPTKRQKTIADERLPLHYLRDHPQQCRFIAKQGEARAWRTGFPLDPCPADMCNCSAGRKEEHRLSYYRILPNYGRTDGRQNDKGYNPNPPGGSREPYPYLQFILDFWDNLPHVLLFTQDDCPQRACVWMQQVHRSMELLQDWRTHWGEAHKPRRADCMCRFMVENIYGPRYYWYGWMAVIQQGIFNQTGATPTEHLEQRGHKSFVDWPKEANFAVGAATVRAVPRWFWEILLRLHVSEKWCHGGSIHWAHTMERMWFEILDPATPKVKTWLTDPRRPLPNKLACLAAAVDTAGSGDGGGWRGEKKGVPLYRPRSAEAGASGPPVPVSKPGSPLTGSRLTFDRKPTASALAASRAAAAARADRRQG